MYSPQVLQLEEGKGFVFQLNLDYLPHVTRGHQTNGELTIFRSLRPGNLRRIEVGRIVFLNRNGRAAMDRSIGQSELCTYVEDFSF